MTSNRGMSDIITDEMANEVVKLSNENDQQYTLYNSSQKELLKYNEMEGEMKGLDKKYNTVLELLGEKAERVSELEADILDMKTVFKEQLESFMK